MPRAATLAVLTALAAPVVGVWTNSAMAEDRYGPPPADTVSPAAQPAAGWLTWSTKTPAPTGEPAQTAAPAPRPERIATAAALPTSLYSSYPSLTPRQAAEPPRPQPWTPPNGETRPAPIATASASSNQPPRFYSVHREFGLTPDPIPLPAQFFADGQAADMAAPPPPLPPRAVAGSQAATSAANTPANRARAADIETADSAAN